MRVKKVSASFRDSVNYPVFTEPNQSFTPRQIIQQFARNELSAKCFEPADNIDDSNYSDDNMVDNIVSFEDEFEAREFMATTKVFKKVNEKDKSSKSEKVEFSKIEVKNVESKDIEKGKDTSTEGSSKQEKK